jgi:ADP-heptose:LPS heptosyltransferase
MDKTTATEKNPSGDLTSTKEVKVIAIKLPFDLQERLQSFPLLHCINEKFPNADIHFFTPLKQIEILNLLPFKAFYHELNEDELTNVFDVHRYSVNAKIHNVDLFISLTNSFLDASLGLALKAKERLGFADGWKKHLFTHKHPRPVGHHLAEDFLSLYSTYTNESPAKIKVLSRELTPTLSDWDNLPYLAINISPLRQAAIEDELAELINFFENQRIVLFSSEDQDKAQLLLQPFLHKLNKKNIYVNFIYEDWIELAKMLAFSRGVITFNGPVASMAAYVGSRTLVLYDSEDPQQVGPYYYLSDVMTLSVNDPTLALKLETQGALHQRSQFNMGEVFYKAFEFFKLRID